MSGTKAGGLKARATNLARHGDDFYHRIGKKGGQNSHAGGFASNPALAIVAGAKGGRISTRKGIKNGEGKMKNLTKKVKTKDIYYDVQTLPNEHILLQPLPRGYSELNHHLKEMRKSLLRIEEKLNEQSN